MNREAAALGVPVYSIFRGKIGAVDRRLQAEGRLILIETLQDVHDKIELKARKRNLEVLATPRGALNDIVQHLEGILKLEFD
jgi:predicted glycosyltransferase